MAERPPTANNNDLCSSLPTKDEILKYLANRGDAHVTIAFYQGTTDDKELVGPVVSILDLNITIQNELSDRLTVVDGERTVLDLDDVAGSETAAVLEEGQLPLGIPDPFTVLNILKKRQNCTNGVYLVRRYVKEILDPILDILVMSSDGVFASESEEDLQGLVAAVDNEDEYRAALMSMRILVHGWIGKDIDYITSMHRDIEDAPYQVSADMEGEVADLLIYLTESYRKIR